MHGCVSKAKKKQNKIEQNKKKAKEKLVLVKTFNAGKRAGKGKLARRTRAL